MGDLTITSTDEPADVVYAFGQQHNLDEAQRSGLLESLCSNSRIACNRRDAIIFETNVTVVNDGSSGDSVIASTSKRFVVMEGQEPADAAHAFVTAYNLTIGYRNAILSEACQFVACTRAEPIIFRQTIKLDGAFEGTEMEITVLEGQEPADIIYDSLKPYDVSFTERQRVMQAAKEEGVVHTREHALVFSEEVQIGSNTIPFYLYDDGAEPIDSLYAFTLEHGTENDFGQFYASGVVPRLCESNRCRRMQPIVWKSRPITSPRGNEILGSFAILRNEEPVDAIDHFAQVHGLDAEYRDSIVEVVCDELPCNRTVPIVWRKTINDEKGNVLGSFDVLEKEEVADAVYRFFGEFTFPLDRSRLKNYFFQNACVHPRVKCTRLVANAYDDDITLNGMNIGRLTIRENQEPADAIYEWSMANELLKEDLDGVVSTLIDEICNENRVKCQRHAPVIKSIPLSGPDGNHVGVFKLMLGQEPIDALYGFFSRHGLFAKGWDIKIVLSQLCAIDGVECTRTEAVKFQSDNFTMGGQSIGPLKIGEKEEVIDVLYRKRLDFNLTIEDQMESFTMICKEADIYCARTRAAVYSMYNISVLDYDRFGNETCQRKYASVQFLAKFADSAVGGTVASFLKNDQVASMVEHPLFGAIVLYSALLFVKLSLLLIERKRRLSAGVYPVAYLYTFILICIFVTKVIEPVDDIDLAVHLQEGLLPALHVLEGEEAADAVLKWGKEAAREHHPIVRQPIHWEILDKICVESQHVPCTRRRAWESVDMGAITLFGNHHGIEYWNPAVDPDFDKTSFCEPVYYGEADACLQHGAEDLCRRLHPQPAGCVRDITMHMANQLNEYDKGRFDSKDAYRKIGLVMDAPDRELFPAMSKVVLSKKVNLAPFSRLDNGTATYDSWDPRMMEAWAAVDAFAKVKDPETREWNDKPCTPLFGGALCAKHDKDGNLMIEA